MMKSFDHFDEIRGEDDFNRQALELFSLHYEKNEVYRQFIELSQPDFDPLKVQYYQQIPCLPIELFKTHKILINDCHATDYFASSGTTGSRQSKHYIPDIKLYEKSFLKGFELFFGDIKKYRILALLPNYMEQSHSSLIYMVRTLIEKSGHPESGFYLYDRDVLISLFQKFEKEEKKVLLFGVSYALWDLSINFPFHLKQVEILETGGMKGRKKELVREELYDILREGFGDIPFYSEYGMAELFSQAYKKENTFVCPPWMKIEIRNFYDPLQYEKNEKSGGINVFDLANVYSCPFIATQDIGKKDKKGGFQVLGRFDQSDLRGCNLLLT